MTVSLLVLANAALAVSVTNFTAGSPISASVMNANFSNVVSAVNALPWTVSGGSLYTTYTATGINNASPLAALDIGVSNGGYGTVTSSTIPALKITNSGAQSLIDFYTGTSWHGRIRSDSSGNIYLIAQTGSATLMVGGDYGIGSAYSLGLTPTGVFQHSNGWYINASGTSNISSDARMKEDVRPVSNALSRLLQVRGVEFTWKKDVPDAGKRSLGVIAQEVEKVFPELVSEDNEKKTVIYTSLIAPVIESIRTLADQVAKLEAKDSEKSLQMSELIAQIQELKAKNSALQKKVDAKTN